VKETFKTTEIFPEVCQNFEVLTAMLLKVQVSEVDQVKHSFSST
jgi:hypothetical protein